MTCAVSASLTSGTGIVGAKPIATFHRGKLLPPELVVVQDGVAFFRGKQINQCTAKNMPQKTAKKAA